VGRRGAARYVDGGSADDGTVILESIIVGEAEREL
jgi:hypothetical protein